MSQSGILKVADSILPPDVATSYVEDVGIAVPIGNILNIFGAGGIVTSGSGNTVTITGGASIATTYTANTGSATPALNNLNIFGLSIAAGSTPVTTLASGSTVTVEVQRSQAIAATDATKIGLSAFNSAQFTVDANGFVGLVGGGSAIEKVNLQTGTTPIVPSSGAITFNGAVVSAGTNPVRTDGTGANTMALEIQISQAIATTDATKIGLSNFSSTMFSVDANGFVTLAGGGQAIDSIGTQTGTNPIVPTATGLVTINGAVVAAGTNPVRSDGTGANTMALEVQISQAIAATDATKIGLANFDSAAFDVDANGFVQLNGGGIAATAFDVQANTAPGTDPVLPTAAGVVTINGAVVANHSVVLETRSRATNAYNLEIQYATSVAATDGTKSGVAHFDSARFSVDASGFVTLNGSGAGETITGNTGGALSPTAGNWNILGALTAAGTSPVTTSGAVSTLTINVQKSQAIASTDATKVGLAVFDSAAFSVDANGFVTLAGGTEAIDSIGVDATSGTGTNPVLPSAAGLVTVNGARVAAGTNPIRTVSTAPNIYQIQVQTTQALAATDATKIGLANFDSARFSVDANGFVTINGSGVGETITGNSGGALNPSSGNWNILGATVASGTAPLVTAGSGSTLTINAQRSQAIASADSTKVGLSNFNSAQFSVDANGFVSATGTVAITTTENTGTATPSAGNLNILGTNSALTGFSPWTTGSGATATINMPGTAKWVVNATANLGTHTTIAAALTSASSGETIFVTPGSYTEDLTLKAGVDIVSFSGEGDRPNVTIIGKATATFTGACTISGIRLQTNSDNLLVVSGSNATVVNLEYCYLNVSNNTGISFTASNTAAVINAYRCRGDIGTTGITIFVATSTGILNFYYCNFTNTGAASTVSSSSAGTLNVYYTYFSQPITTTSTNAIVFVSSTINSGNNTSMTVGGSGTNSIQLSSLIAGSASALSCGGVVNVHNTIIESTNTNAITGAGTLNWSEIAFSSTSHTINTTTLSFATTSGGQYKGRQNNTAPAAGMIGERISAAATAVSLTSTVPKTITNIDLTPGIWDVSILFVGNNSGTAMGAAKGGIGTVTNTFAGNSGDQFAIINGLSQATNLAVSIPNFRVSLNATTTYYLIGQVNSSGGTNTGDGRISATRVA